MFQLTILYSEPQDSAAFDYYNREMHAVLVQKIPGIKGFVNYKPASLNPKKAIALQLVSRPLF